MRGTPYLPEEQPELLPVGEKRMLSVPTQNTSDQNPQSETSLLVRMAIEKNLDIEKLEKLLELHERNEARQAEKEFEKHFAEMQKEYVPAYKTKSGYNDTYQYSPLEEVQSVYMPILTKHGFSIRWELKDLKEISSIEITCYLSGYGFTRTASMVLPYAKENNAINPIQARAITVSYGKRYTFMVVTGCITANEDKDGQLPEQNPNKIVKQIEKEISFIPEKLRSGFRDELAKSKNSELEELYKKVWNVREDCRILSMRAKKADELQPGSKKKEEVIKKLSQITTIDQLFDMGVEYADLPKLDTGK